MFLFPGFDPGDKLIAKETRTNTPRDTDGDSARVAPPRRRLHHPQRGTAAWGHHMGRWGVLREDRSTGDVALEEMILQGKNDTRSIKIWIPLQSAA